VNASAASSTNTPEQHDRRIYVPHTVTVSGNLQFHSNAGAGNTIVQTTVHGNLQCQGNHDVNGGGNTVTGNRQGQCVRL
jgi:hypothetical protein